VSKKSLLLWLLLISWTQSSAQTQGSSLALRDTNRCYTPTELKAIALKLIHGAECDTLLKIANLTITAQDTAIKSQAKTIEKQDLRYITTEHLVDEVTLQRDAIKKDLKKSKRRLVWTKVGWAITTVVLTTTTVLALVK
jgi:hypothetical protein